MRITQWKMEGENEVGERERERERELQDDWGSSQTDQGGEPEDLEDLSPLRHKRSEAKETEILIIEYTNTQESRKGSIRAWERKRTGLTVNAPRLRKAQHGGANLRPSRTSSGIPNLADEVNTI